MNELSTREEADALFEKGEAILFKHNTTCPISASAHQEMESFLSGNAGAPLYKIDINAARDVSDHVAERTGIAHESPQVIVLRGGRPAWNASLFDITAAALREQVGGGARA
ncbi:MAG TPA: bacillithiol system redox-active protein YtxJ [Longimicrobium sp.]|nr:bacillithiol system redox-active protein YtxJ [Longimicrobium sp.]